MSLSNEKLDSLLVGDPYVVLSAEIGIAAGHRFCAAG
jgi:hypothetical protein